LKQPRALEIDRPSRLAKGGHFAVLDPRSFQSRGDHDHTIMIAEAVIMTTI
jgi:hypothetical protein